MLTTSIGLVFDNVEARVAYYCAEAPEDVATSRIPAICEHFGKTVDDLQATGRFALLPAVPRLLDPQDVEAAADEVENLKPNIIVIDTTARGLIGYKKNEDAVMTAAAESGEGLRKKFGALVAMIAHEGKDRDRGTKGPSDFEQIADQVIRLKVSGNIVSATMAHTARARPITPGISRSRSIRRRGNTSACPCWCRLPAPPLPLRRSCLPSAS